MQVAVENMCSCKIVNIYIYADFMCAISTSEKGGHQAAAAAENMDLLMVHALMSKLTCMFDNMNI